MNHGQERWAVLQNLLGALAAQYSADFREAVQAAGLAREPVGVLLLAANIDPNPLTATRLLDCLPYYAERAFSSRLDRLVAAGWLQRVPDGDVLTVRGRAAAQALHAAVKARLNSLAPLPPAGLERLAELLERLFDACRLSEGVLAQGCVTASGNASWRPNPGAPPLERIARTLEALVNFRCDAHRAAWRPWGIVGPAWETLTWLWQGRAASPHSLHAWAEAQPFPRGHSADDYAGFLRELEGRGWAAPESDRLWRITPSGTQVREEAEAQTEALFFKPWSVLAAEELRELAASAKFVVESLGGPG